MSIKISNAMLMIMMMFYHFIIRSSVSHSLYRPVYHTVVTWVSWLSTASATEKGVPICFITLTSLSHVDFGLLKKSGKNVIGHLMLIALLFLEAKPLLLAVYKIDENKKSQL